MMIAMMTIVTIIKSPLLFFVGESDQVSSAGFAALCVMMVMMMMKQKKEEERIEFRVTD